MKQEQADAERVERLKQEQVEKERNERLNKDKKETEKEIIAPIVLETEPKPSFFQKNRVAVLSGSCIAAALLIWQLTKSDTLPQYSEQNKPILQTEQPKTDIPKTEIEDETKKGVVKLPKGQNRN